MIATCVALIVIAMQQLQKPPQATATLRGHVIAGDTGQPLRKAQVRLMFNQSPGDSSPFGERQGRLATTDANGNYEFAGLAAGRYTMLASKPGYVGRAWGQERSNEPGKAIDVGAGATIEHLDFTLPRGGVMTGRIFDEFGEPLSGIQVSAMRRQPNGGQRDLMQMASGETNDLGEFRIYGLGPGQYYLQATWRRIGFSDPTSPDRTGYPPTFFPGTTDAASAQRFTIGAGQTIGDLAMALSPIKTVRIEGIAVDSNDRPLANGSVGLIQESGTSGFTSGGGGVRPDGTFVLTNVAPGAYVLRAQAMDDRHHLGMMKLSVGTEDITNLRVVALPPSKISGRVVIDPAQAASLSTMAFAVTASAVGPLPFGHFLSAPPVKVADDLTFEVTAPVGKYAISVTSLPAGWSVRSLRVNNIDVTDDGIDVKPNERITGVEVELTNKVTTISGIVTDARGAPAKNCWTVVFAADSRRWTPYSRYRATLRSDQDGQFKTTSLPPSDYYIIALETTEPPPTGDPDFLERIRAKATSFSLREGERKTFDLKLNSQQ